MAMTISARSVLGHFARPRIKLLTIGSVSLFEASFKRLFQLQEKLFGLHVVAHANFHARAAGDGQRDQRQDDGAHLLLLPAEDFKHTDQGHDGSGDSGELLRVNGQTDSRGKGQQAGVSRLLFES